MAKWDYEHTDTFGGEANYSWVNRGTVSIPGDDPVRTVKKILGMTGVRCSREDDGDMITLIPRGMNQVIFITWHDCGEDNCKHGEE